MRAALLLAVVLSPFSVFAATLTTVAGGGIVDGVAGAVATFSAPAGIAVDGPGNVYVADEGNNRVRKIDAVTGTVSTIAGSTNSGYSGDGGPATQATLNAPFAVALNAAATVLYISDSGNNAIRSVTLATGIINTVAGNGKSDFAGDGGPATSATLNSPAFICLDAAGNLFIADQFNDRIRKVDTTGNISTIAGIGVPDSTGDGGPATSAAVLPYGIAVDSKGNIFFTTALRTSGIGNQVRKIDTTGTITTLAGNSKEGFGGDGGPATAAVLDFPAGIVVDAAGNLLFADNFNNAIRKIDTTGVITSVIGSPTPGTSGGFSGDGGPATKALLSNPLGVGLNAAGDVYVCDSANNRIRVVLKVTQNISTLAGSGAAGDGGPAVQATMNRARGVAVDATGSLFISDFNNDRIRRVDAVTGVITTIAGTGTSAFSGDGGPAVSAAIGGPIGIVIDKNGDIVFVDSANRRVRKITTKTGVINTIAGSGTDGDTGDNGPALSAAINPVGLAVDSKNQVYLAEFAGNVIRRVDSKGIITTVVGSGTAGFAGDGGPATAAQLTNPDGITFDSSDNLFIADFGNAAVRMVSAATGNISTVAGGNSQFFVVDGDPATSGSLAHPSQVAVDSSYLYINERDLNQIRVVSLSTGIIGPLAGTGIRAILGDNGPATAARLLSLDGIILDSLGNVFFCDQDRVRTITVSDTKQIAIAPFPTRSGVSTTFSTQFSLAGATFSWTFGDGGTASGQSVTHTYATGGQFTATLTVTSGATTVTIKRDVLIFAPTVGSEPITNPSTTITPPKLPGREAITVMTASGGALQFQVDSSNTNGQGQVLITNANSFATTAVSAVRSVTRDDIPSLLEGRSGGTFVQRFPVPGLYVMESKHFAHDNSVASHGRKTVAVSKPELNQTIPFTDNRTSTKLTLSALKGTFQLPKTTGLSLSSDRSLVDTRAAGKSPIKPDTVTLKMTFNFPTGVDTTKPQEMGLGVGNIVDTFTISAKGKPTLTSMQHLKSLTVMYGKGKKAGTATLSATYSKTGLVAAGFDTEGITANETDLNSKGSAPRSIQVVMMYAGLSYESQASVTFQKSLRPRAIPV